MKVFKIPGDGPERDKAYGRLDAEVKALSEISHQAVLKLLHYNRHKDFIVTEYHPLGHVGWSSQQIQGARLGRLVGVQTAC